MYDINKFLKVFSYIFSDDIYTSFFLDIYVENLRNAGKLFENLYYGKITPSGITENIFENFINKYFKSFDSFIKNNIVD